MALSVVDLYAKALPKTNCGDCGYPTCMAFAGMVVSQKHPLSGCPHLSKDTLNRYQPELDDQHAAGKWTQRDLAADALVWAKERAASMEITDLPRRIGGRLIQVKEKTVLELPYFTGKIHIHSDRIVQADGRELSRWEQVFLFNHMAQGGSKMPTGRWKSLKEIPNTVSKIKSMQSKVEAPLRRRFSEHREELAAAGAKIGAKDMTAQVESADLALLFQPLPRVPVMLLFWDADPDSGFEAEIKLAFDETITDHLDIESILFLSEHLTGLLMDII